MISKNVSMICLINRQTIPVRSVIKLNRFSSQRGIFSFRLMYFLMGIKLESLEVMLNEINNFEDRFE